MVGNLVIKCAAHTITIAAGATKSAPVDLEAAMLCGIVLPAALTSTSLTFETSVDGVTFAPLVDEVGVAVTVAGLVAGKDVSLGSFAKHLFGVRWLKLVAGSTEAAERLFTLRTRPAA